MQLENIFPKIFLYFLPLNIFILMVFTQASYCFIRYQKDNNTYIPQENLLTINAKTLKENFIYLDPAGKYFFDNKFIDLLSTPTKEFSNFLKNIRFVKQQMFIFTGSKRFSAFMSNIERLKQSPIQVGVNKDGSPNLCYKPNVFQILFEFESMNIVELDSLATRFACECNGYDIHEFDLSKLSPEQKLDYLNAHRAFLREALGVLKPIKTSTNLSYWNFFHYVIMNNVPMNSPGIMSNEVDYSKAYFAIITYFLLGLQVAILGNIYAIKIGT